MATKKQRRRRAKDRRHEWEYVYVDDSGQEVEADEDEPPAKPAGAAEARPKPAGKSSAGRRSGRALRQPLPPSWKRSARRALPWQLLIIIVVVFVFRSAPVASRVLIAVLYGVAFVPFTYWVDKLAWQRFQRTSGRLPDKGKKQKR